LGSYYQFLDPALLKSDLIESLYYLHIQPPLFNLFLGVILKVFPNGETVAFTWVYLMLGLVLHVSLFLLMTRLGVSTKLSAILTLLFMISPPCILYENWLFYTYPVTTFLVLSALFWHRFLSSGALRDGAALFTLLAVIVLTRSFFHIMWFLLFVVVLLLRRWREWRRVVLASCIPFVVILFVYAKNLCLFGDFAGSRWLGMSLSKMTTVRLPEVEQRRMIREGRVSRLALAHPFGGPDYWKYRDYFLDSRIAGVPVLDEELKSTGHANYNHIAYLDISRQFLDDALTVLVTHPTVYLTAVATAFDLYLSPASHSETLRRNRTCLRTFEAVYNGVLHGQWPVKRGPSTKRGGIGEYYLHELGSKEWLLSKAWFLFIGCPLLLAYGLFLVRRAISGHFLGEPVAMTVLFLLANTVYLSLVANALEISENNRFRFVIDPLLLALLGLLLDRGLRGLRRRAANPERRNR
jgi:hypothetical protein